MKTIVSVYLIATFFIFSADAQNSKRKTLALPAKIVEWNGEDSDKILNDPVLIIRLKKLLGERNYASFLESFETLSPIERNSGFLFSSGCLIHACQHLESAVAIDLINNTVHAAIYRENQRTKYFNESGTKTPRSITNWAERLDCLNNYKK